MTTAAVSIQTDNGEVESQSAGVIRGTLSSRRAQVGLAITGFVVLVAFLGPLFAPHTITAFVATPFSGPSSKALLGTDYLGRDVLSRVLYGGRSVVWMSLSATALGVGAGALVGMAAAYAGGWFGGLIMRSTDAVLAFPYIVLVLLVISIVGPRLWLVVLMVAFGWVPVVARVAYGVTLQIAQREYVQAVEVIGISRRAILIKEVWPNLATPLMVQFGQYIAWSVGIIAGLSFLGFGVQPPTADWGLMINENRDGIASQPWAVVAPLLMIALFTVGVNLLTDGFSRWLAGIDGDDAQ